MKAFTDHRRVIWLGGVAVLVVGFLVAALVLPSTTDPTENMGPSINVPKMENVPNEGDRVKLDVEEKAP